MTHGMWGSNAKLNDLCHACIHTPVDCSRLLSVVNNVLEQEEILQSVTSEHLSEEAAQRGRTFLPRSTSTTLSVSLSFSERSTNKLVLLQSKEKRVSISWALERDVCSVSTSLLVLWIGFGLGWVGCLVCWRLLVEQLLDPIPSSNHLSRKSSEAVEVIHILSRVSFLQFLSEQLAGYTEELGACGKGWWRSIEFDGTLNPFFWASLMSTQYTVFCFFHAFCMCRARRGASKSIVLGSFCSLSVEFTNRKNTVSLLLKFCLPNINPDLLMECKLIAHPTL